MAKNQRNFDSLLAHAGGINQRSNGPVNPPIHLSTTFVRDSNYALVNKDNLYGRDDNDLYRQIESVMVQLENGSSSRVFSSGMAAISAIIRSIPTGSSLLIQSGIYWGTTLWIRHHCMQSGINLIELDATDGKNFQLAIQKEKPVLVFLEFPSNPWLKIADLELIATTCNETETLLVVDTTVATPLLCRPLELGADIVVHSATKVLNGHSDLIAGMATTRNSSNKHWQLICEDRKYTGSILGSFEAWLLLRGMRTLPLRLERMNRNAMEVAQYLSDHERVEQVYYPGLKNHPNHKIASRLMDGGYGYLLSFTVKGNRKVALEIVGKLKLILRATSIGGVESLIEHRNSIEGPESTIPENLLRLSLGIENCPEIIEDLEQALNS